jgi:hypothetical protein
MGKAPNTEEIKGIRVERGSFKQFHIKMETEID